MLSKNFFPDLSVLERRGDDYDVILNQTDPLHFGPFFKKMEQIVCLFGFWHVLITSKKTSLASNSITGHFFFAWVPDWLYFC